jgi:hypothetical protein
MVSSAKRALRRHFRGGETGSPVVEAGSSRTPESILAASGDFEWPPPEQVLESRIVEFAREPLEPRAPLEPREFLEPRESPETGRPSIEPEDPPSPHMPAAVDAQEMSILPRHSPARPRQNIARRLASLSSVRSRVVIAAQVALAVAAVGEGVFIFRTLRSPSQASASGAVSTPPILRSSPIRAPVVPAAAVQRQSVAVARPSIAVAPAARPILRRPTTAVSVPVRSPAPGGIEIESPIEVNVYENGALIGTSRSPQLMLSSGPHTLELVNTATGFRQRSHILVTAGRVEKIGVEAPHGMIHVNAVPWAEVWIDGESVGETPIGNLSIPIGPHQVVFRHPDLGERTVSTVVKMDVPSLVTTDLRPLPPVAQ